MDHDDAGGAAVRRVLLLAAALVAVAAIAELVSPLAAAYAVGVGALLGSIYRSASRSDREHAARERFRRQHRP